MIHDIEINTIWRGTDDATKMGWMDDQGGFMEAGGLDPARPTESQLNEAAADLYRNGVRGGRVYLY